MAVIIDTKHRNENVSEEQSSNQSNAQLKNEFTKLTLGPRKSVGIKPWKAKAKKDFVKVFKAKGEKTSEKDILDVLVFPYIDNKDVFYSSAELQYILVKIRELSIKDDSLSFAVECNNCKHDIDVQTVIDDLIDYKETLMPVEKNNTFWQDPISIEYAGEKLLEFSEEPPNIVMMGMNIKSYQGHEIHNIPEFIELYDDLDMNEAQQLEDDWNEIISKFELSKFITCDNCGEAIKYTFDVIPGFFDPLLPKE